MMNIGDNNHIMVNTDICFHEWVLIILVSIMVWSTNHVNNKPITYNIISIGHIMLLLMLIKQM